jgi:hypothetical protein
LKVYEDKTEPAKTYKAHVKTQCDLCKKEGPRHNWSDECYYRETTELTLREGTTYPDGGSGTEIRVDICPSCFREKLVPWLESQGAKVAEEDWDW